MKNFHVETFVAVGGAAYGFQNCDRKRKACNDFSSMYCGSLVMARFSSLLSKLTSILLRQSFQDFHPLKQTPLLS